MDLADQIDDYICNFEGIGDLAMDSLAMFIFIWAVIALFLVWLCKFFYTKYMKKDDGTSATSTSSSSLLNSSKTNNNNSVNLNGANKLLDGDKLRRSEPRDITASKEKDLFGKSRGSGGRGRTGGSGFTSPAAPARKRIVRQSPGPELRKKRTVAPPSNVIGPETSSVTWTSQVFRWLYSDLVIVNELLNTWVQVLNDNLKNSEENNGVGVEIVRVLPDSPPPSLANIFCQAEESHPSDMIITCDCDSQPVLQVKAYRQKNGKLDVSHYKVTISRLRARLQAAMSYNTLKGLMKIEGYPDIRITMNSVGAIKAIDQDEQQLQDVIGDILTAALKDTIYPVDFSIYSTCPRAEIEQSEIPVILPIHYDSMAYNMENLNMTNRLSGSHGAAISSGKRLLVKIVKGEGLASGQGCYVVIEMDEPPQKNQTGARQGLNPHWDEHFLFDLSNQSAEILFEIYDSGVKPNDPPKFLGLGLVGIDELAVGPASSQILALQPRPYETTNVQGAIMVEFVFIEGAEIPAGPRPYKLKEALRISSPIINEHLKNGADLADAAVKALQDGALTTNGNPSKSTLIIHSVQRSRSPFKVELNRNGEIEMKQNEMYQHQNGDDDTTGTTNQYQYEENRNVTTTDLVTNSSDNDNHSPDIVDHFERSNIHENQLESGSNGLNNTNNSNHGATIDINDTDEFGGRPIAQSSPQTNGNGNLPLNHSNTNSLARGDQQQQQMSDDERGRSRKKRDFFGTLKRRLGKSKTRTRSAERDMIPIDANNPLGGSRSVSMDRGANSTSNSLGPKIVVPTLDHSRRSSISESSAISGFSSASTKTYLHEASTLVLETIENGIKRHFLVPLAIAQRPRWRRKGTKLHIYNDHTFVAKHLSGGGLNCSICTKSIPRRPGKQGYECRDCQLICHKQCHVRAPQSCSNPTVLSMELSKLNSAAADRSIRKL